MRFWSWNVNMTVLDALSDKIADDQERRDFRRHLADIIVVYTDMLIAVIHQYPELDPDIPSSTSGAGQTQLQAAAIGAPRAWVENHSRSSWRNCSRT